MVISVTSFCNGFSFDREWSASRRCRLLATAGYHRLPERKNVVTTRECDLFVGARGWPLLITLRSSRSRSYYLDFATKMDSFRTLTIDEEIAKLLSREGPRWSADLDYAAQARAAAVQARRVARIAVNSMGGDRTTPRAGSARTWKARPGTLTGGAMAAALFHTPAP